MFLFLLCFFLLFLLFLLVLLTQLSIRMFTTFIVSLTSTACCLEIYSSRTTEVTGSVANVILSEKKPHLSLCLSLCFSVYLSLCMSVSLCLSLNLSLSVSMSLAVSVALSVCLSLYLCLSVCLSPHNPLVCSDEGPTLETSATHQITQVKTITISTFVD